MEDQLLIKRIWKCFPLAMTNFGETELKSARLQIDKEKRPCTASSNPACNPQSRLKVSSNELLWLTQWLQGKRWQIRWHYGNRNVSPWKFGHGGLPAVSISDRSFSSCWRHDKLQHPAERFDLVPGSLCWMNCASQRGFSLSLGTWVECIILEALKQCRNVMQRESGEVIFAATKVKGVYDLSYVWFTAGLISLGIDSVPLHRQSKWSHAFCNKAKNKFCTSQFPPELASAPPLKMDGRIEAAAHFTVLCRLNIL